MHIQKVAAPRRSLDLHVFLCEYQSLCIYFTIVKKSYRVPRGNRFPGPTFWWFPDIFWNMLRNISIHLSIFVSVHPSIYLSDIFLFVYLSIDLSTHLSCLFVFKQMGCVFRTSSGGRSCAAPRRRAAAALRGAALHWRCEKHNLFA